MAEVGTPREQFPGADHLASWAGTCSGNNASAGQRRRGRITEGNRWRKRILVQAAWAASHTTGTYLAAPYRRLAKRRGCQRALVAVGHALLVIAYPVLKRGTTYAELGADFPDRLEPARLTRRLVKRLEALGPGHSRWDHRRLLPFVFVCRASFASSSRRAVERCGLSSLIRFVFCLVGRRGGAFLILSMLILLAQARR